MRRRDRAGSARRRPERRRRARCPRHRGPGTAGCRRCRAGRPARGRVGPPPAGRGVAGIRCRCGDPAGSVARSAPSRATRASRGSSRGGTTASRSRGSGAVGRSFRECTAMSARPSATAWRTPATKTPAPPMLARECPVDVALGDHLDQLQGHPGALGDQLAHGSGLGHRQGGAPGRQPQGPHEGHPAAHARACRRRSAPSPWWSASRSRPGTGAPLPARAAGLTRSPPAGMRRGRARTSRPWPRGRRRPVLRTRCSQGEGPVIWASWKVSSG